MGNKQGPVLGVSIYSFTNEWLLRQYDLEGMLAKVAALGLGPAIEVVGFQSFRTYPTVTPEFAKQFRDLLDKYELTANCLGANVDIGIRKGQMMTIDESVEYIARQIEVARMLGFKVLRSQTYANTAELDMIIPIAEKAGVHVASEVHAPLTLDHPILANLLEYHAKVQSPWVGIIPDFGATMKAPPDIYWESIRQDGAGDELIAEIREIWHTDLPMNTKFQRVGQAAERFKAGPALVSRLNNVITMFGHMPVEDWREVLPYSRHIHGKFYSVANDGLEPAVPYDKIMALLKEVGYTGTISAEWEGHAFNDAPIGFETVTAWRKMCSRLLAD